MGGGGGRGGDGRGGRVGFTLSLEGIKGGGGNARMAD